VSQGFHLDSNLRRSLSGIHITLTGDGSQTGYPVTTHGDKAVSLLVQPNSASAQKVAVDEPRGICGSYRRLPSRQS